MDEKKELYIHPSAVVDEGSEIGDGTKIYHFCHIMGGASIGKNCILGQNVFVASGAVVGNGVKIQNNVSVYDGVVLEDEVFVGPSAVFTNVKTPRAHVSRKGKYVSTVVKRGATIGANATIVCGITIEEFGFVSAGAVVTRNVGAHEVVAGVPAIRIGWACTCGVILPDRRHGGTCPECGRSWKFGK